MFQLSVTKLGASRWLNEDEVENFLNFSRLYDSQEL